MACSGWKQPFLCARDSLQSYVLDEVPLHPSGAEIGGGRDPGVVLEVPHGHSGHHEGEVYAVQPVMRHVHGYRRALPRLVPVAPALRPPRAFLGSGESPMLAPAGMDGCPPLGHLHRV